MIWRLRGRRRGSVTLVKSNAKALLTACGHQKMLFALFEEACTEAVYRILPLCRDFAPAACGLLPSAQCPLKRAAARLAETSSVTNRDGGDDVLGLTSAHQKTVTVVTL